jgi:anthranilate phosphoribosyltransferase
LQVGEKVPLDETAQAVAIARDIIHSGAAWQKFEHLVAFLA